MAGRQSEFQVATESIIRRLGVDDEETGPLAHLGSGRRGDRGGAFAAPGGCCDDDDVIVAEFFPSGSSVRMVVSLHPMHNEKFTRMSVEGFTSQLTKLDKRFGAAEESKA
jgi:hypothetical protein